MGMVQPIMPPEFRTAFLSPPLFVQHSRRVYNKPIHKMQNEKYTSGGVTESRVQGEERIGGLTGAKTHAQIASDYGISPDLVKNWKQLQGEYFRCSGRKSEKEKMNA